MVKKYIAAHANVQDTPKPEEIDKQESVVNVKAEPNGDPQILKNTTVPTTQAFQSTESMNPPKSAAHAASANTTSQPPIINVIHAKYTKPIDTTNVKPSNRVTQPSQIKQHIPVPKYVDSRPKVSKEQNTTKGTLDPYATSFAPAITTSLPTYDRPSVVMSAHLDDYLARRQGNMEHEVQSGLSAIAKSLADQES